MSTFNDSKYQPCREWLSEKIDDGVSWDRLKTLDVPDDRFSETLADLKDLEGWPTSLDRATWEEYVEHYRKNIFLLADVNQEVLGIDCGSFENQCEVPTGPTSSWEAYKNALDLGPASIAEIENSSLWVLRHLRDDTREKGPVKGLVAGSVQSGKTAMMAGLVSMAADYRWNFFIILSGTIDNLRIQTRDRFARDLQDSEGVSWRILDFSNDDKNFRGEDMRLGSLKGANTFPTRYVTVCLKNKERLRRLIDFLYEDRARASKLRILIIDDEADQASINTADITDDEFQERKTINQLIVNLTSGRLADGEEPPVQLQAINYVSFTATPYANVLNEASEESLYPRDFVCALNESKEYFGPLQIFGWPTEGYEGLDIIRNIGKADLSVLDALHEGVTGLLPEKMRNSLAWFLCASAVLRKEGHSKPISMLVHTSHLVDKHRNVFSGINRWLGNKDEVLAKCEEIYAEEISAVTREDLRIANPEYPDLDKVKEFAYSFEDIRGEIDVMLSQLTNIQLDEEGNPVYSSGVHLCLDNTEAEHIASGDVHLRIIYPDSEQLSQMDKAPVFIVLGGNTLSRGLTLEGLVCTYFAREVSTADTLMQMGRWFGYRRGYELLQRIWLTSDANDKYMALAKVDLELKRELRMFMDNGLSPAEFGPRVRNVDEIKKFSISSKRKTQSASPVDWSFNSYDFETTYFDDDGSIEENLSATKNLAEHLFSVKGAPIEANPNNTAGITAYLWKDVPHEEMMREFFDGYRLSVHGDKIVAHRNFLTWLGSTDYRNWNVAFVNGPKRHRVWNGIPNAPLGFISRTKYKDNEDCIYIKSLRDGRHVLFDVDVDALDSGQKAFLKDSWTHGKDTVPARARLGLSKVPLLLVYLIDKDGGVETSQRIAPGTASDIVGISIAAVDGTGLEPHAEHLAIKMPGKDSDV